MPQGKGWRLAPIGGTIEDGEISLLGPAEAPIALLRGRHRFRLAVKAPRGVDLQAFLRALLENASRVASAVRRACMFLRENSLRAHPARDRKRGRLAAGLIPLLTGVSPGAEAHSLDELDVAA